MKTVLITGASSGMGKETAKKFLENKNYKVYVAARRVDRMEDLVKLGAIALAMDITKDEEILRLVETIETQEGGVDILINNAGFGSYGSMEDTSLEDARYQFEVNLFGLARLTQLILPSMRAKKWGKIVNISSMGGKIYTPLGAWYHATKHALEGWSDCLRLELAPFGIDVIVFEPGAIQTEFGDVLIGPMMERSGHTAYKPLAESLKKATSDIYKNNGATPASVVAKWIVRSVEAKRPKTRYVVGKMARPLLFIRKWFGDRIFDKLIMMQAS